MAICHYRKLGLPKTDINLLIKHYASRVSNHDSGFEKLVDIKELLAYTRLESNHFPLLIFTQTKCSPHKMLVNPTYTSC